jgi:hypothetical protein
MDMSKVEAMADYISMDLASRVINRTLDINEAMYTLIQAVALLLARTLPAAAFQLEINNSKALAHEVAETINRHISENKGTSPAKIMLSLNLVMELILETVNKS